MHKRRFVSVVFVGFAGLAFTLGAPAQARADAPPGSAGEALTVRTVVDGQQNNMPVETFSAPQSWADRSDTRWNLANTTDPVSISIAVENAQTGEGLFTYPSADFIAPMGLHREGPTPHGKFWLSPMPPDQAISAYAQHARGNLPGFRIIGVHEAPNLPALRQMDASQHPRGVAVRVTYELAGKPVEEDFFGAYHLETPCSNVGPGRVCETDWGLYEPFSFRAPAGTLDRKLPLFWQIFASRHQNPAWVQRAIAIRSQLIARSVHSHQEHAARSQAAAARADQIVARSNAFLAREDARYRAMRTSGGGAGSDQGSPGRSSADRWSDYYRDQTTVEDPNTGTTQRSSSNSYHWTDGNGSYRDSNDANYDPNKSENGNWTLMQEAK